MKKFRVLFLLALVFLLSLSICATDHIIDNASLIDEDGIGVLESYTATIERERGLRCVFLTGYDLGDLDDTLAEYAAGAEDMALLAVDLSAMEYVFYQYNATKGEDAFRIDGGEIQQLLEELQEDLSEGNYAEAQMTFVKRALYYFEHERPLSDSHYIMDYAQLLTADEYAELDAYAAQVEANTGLRCVFLTGYSLGSVNERLSVYADGAQDLSLIAVDMYERRFDHYQYNATDGYLAFRLNNRETDDILDTMQPLMHGGEYFAAAKTFVSLSAEYFANSDNFSLGKDGFGENGYTGVNTPSVFDYGARAYLIFILKGALIGLAVGAIVALSLFAAYKHKVHGNTYPLDEFTKMKLTAQHDNFLYKNVVATKIESSSSSGGGGGHSGGGGGGGGHSGGRSF